jgi:Mg2+ and Co2+ transporter CorA
MIKVIYAKNGSSAVEMDIAKVPGILEQKPRLVWIDIIVDKNELENEEIALLSDCFKFHELSIEDCLFPQYHPKVEEFENYVFVAVHGIRLKAKDLAEFENSVYELDLFIGKDYVVTVHAGELAVIDTLFERVKLKPQVELKSMESLLYSIFQKVVASYEFTVDKLGDRFDTLEDRIITEPSSEQISEIFDQKKILLNLRHTHPINQVRPVADGQDLLGFQDEIGDVYVDDTLQDYILSLVEATRNHPDLALGGSPRASLALHKASQALAAVRGRDYVIPDDVKSLARITLGHRLIVKPEAQLRGKTADTVLGGILESIPLELAQ